MYEEIIKLIENNEFDKALAQIEKLQQNDPKKYNLTGLVYFNKRELDKAKEAFEKGLKIAPIDSDLLFNYGYLLKELGQEMEAWRYLMRIHNKDWATYDLLGDIEYKNRSKVAAIRFYKKAAELTNNEEMKRKFLAIQESTKSDMKIAFLCLPGLDSFLKDIVEAFSLAYDVRLVVTSKGEEIAEAIRWADIVWLEWANEMAVFATNKVPEILNKKVVCRLHSYEVFTPFPEQINWNNVDSLVFVSEHIRRTFNDLHPDIKIDLRKELIIENGVDLDRFKFSIHEPGYNLAVVAHVNYKKDPTMWIQIMARLAERDKRYKLHVAGDFQDSRYGVYFDHIKREMNIENNLILHGWVENVDEFLRDKNYVLSTSIHESFGYNIAEGMASGIKLIIHNYAGAKEQWPKELIYNTIDEAVEKIIDKDYDSERYRRFIEDNYPLQKQIVCIENLLSGDFSGLQDKLRNVMVTSYDKGTFENELQEYRGKIKKLTEHIDESLDEIFSKVNNSNTVVSIITPSFNGSKFLPQLLNSLRMQIKAQEIEWIIVDDCSDDDSMEFYKSLSSESTIGKIRIFRNRSNVGAALSLKRGVNLSSSDIIAWVSADDCYISNDKIEKDLQILSLDKDIVFSRYTILGPNPSDGKMVKVIGDFSSDKYSNLLNIMISNPLNGSSMVMKKDTYRECAGFNEFLVNTDGDFDLWARAMLLQKKIAFSDTTVFNTQHPNQTSRSIWKMVIGCNITRLSYVKLLEQTGEIEAISNKFMRMHDVDKVLLNLVASYRYAWIVRLFQHSLVVPKDYKKLFEDTPDELRSFLDVIDNLSDEFMNTSIFQQFANHYKMLIGKGNRV
ncbi:MAG TPA: glycosyltransferase [Fervidobacterium sp.]|nr:glycosyltransferase [Fervidobacterium sp.]